MPSASTTAKLEKQASSEASDPIRQGIVFVEHKIRNLIKKKARLDTYKEIQKSGKELDSDQKQALLKYDELNQNIVFAQDLSKQLTTIAQDNVKLQKKKEKKEAYEREQQEAAKIKEILIIQDVLANMGNDTVREDFLAGKNKAVKLTEAELQFLDELFVEVAPKREPEEGQPPFIEQAQNAAKHLLSIVEGKEKEIIGTKYSVLKEIIGKINSCGYFDHTVEEPITQQETVAEIPLPPAEPEPEPEPEPQLPQVNSVPSQQFEPNAVSSVAGDVVAAAPPVMETAGLYISQRPMADVLTNVMGPVPAAFSFIQESQLESPDLGGVAPLPIPTQTFTNASFATSAAPMPMPVAVAVVPSAVYVAQSEPPAAAAAYETQQPAVQSQQFEPSSNLPSSTPQAGDGDWNDAPEQSNDWSMQAEQGSWSETPQAESNDWANDSANDGFQPAVRGGGRGRGRGGHRGGPRGERGGRGGGGYQNGRGGGGYGSQNGGRGGYNRNGEGGGGNYYQNGYQSRGDGERGGRDYNREGGQRRGGPRGGGTSDRGAPRQDRGGAPRGTGGRGGPRGRGEGRGRQ